MTISTVQFGGKDPVNWCFEKDFGNQLCGVGRMKVSM